MPVAGIGGEENGESNEARNHEEDVANVWVTESAIHLDGKRSGQVAITDRMGEVWGIQLLLRLVDDWLDWWCNGDVINCQWKFFDGSFTITR